MPDMTPYSTADQFISSLPMWITDPLERMRVGSYALYDMVYWSVPDSLQLLHRGSDVDPIYVPAAKQIVNTIARYTAPAMAIVADPQYGTQAERDAALLTLQELFRREKFYSKFGASKKEGIRRGDWFFHIVADIDRPEGSRISIQPVDPGPLFPIYNEDNIDEVVGWHIVDTFLDEMQRQRIRRWTYRKESGKGGPSRITVEGAIFEADEWGGPGMDPRDEKMIKVLQEPAYLPDPIDHIPIYHIQNIYETGTIFGASELRGLERLIAAIDQSISDEELTLAMDGLGVYATNAGTPIDGEGNEVGWNLGPARVVELPTGTTDAMFKRVSGVTTVSPFQDHLKYLHEQLDGAAATPAVAKGNVDVKVAESGIALRLQLAPILSVGEEKDVLITDVLTQMLFDLRKFFLAYEGRSLRVGMEQCQFLPVYGDKIPENKADRFEKIVTLYDKGLVSIEWVWTELKEIGYDIGDATDMMTAILTEKQNKLALEADALGVRMDSEVNDDGDGSESSE